VYALAVDPPCALTIVNVSDERVVTLTNSIWLLELTNATKKNPLVVAGNKEPVPDATVNDRSPMRIEDPSVVVALFVNKTGITNLSVFL
jgi:hypothetical protein